MKNITLIKKSMLLLALLSCGISGWAQNSITKDLVTYYLHGDTAEVMSADPSIVNCTIPSTVESNGKTYTVRIIDGTGAEGGMYGGAFFKCSHLKTVVLPNTVTWIGPFAFYKCESLESVTLSESIKEIGMSTFYGCTALTKIVLPEGLIKIDNAFTNCSSLADVTFPTTLREISSTAFSGTPWFNNQPDGILYAGKSVYTYKGTMPENTTLTLKEGTYALSKAALKNYKNLVGINFPESFTYADAESLDGTTWLENQPDGAVYAGKSLYKYKGSTTAKTSIAVKEGTLSISPNAFSGMTGLSAVQIPETVTRIGEQAFQGCNSLTTLTLPKSVQTIDMWSAFGQSSAIKDLTVEWTTPVDFSLGYSYLTQGVVPFTNCTLRVPKGSLQAYQTGGWLFFNMVEYAPDGISTAKATDDISVAGKVVTSHRAQTVSLYDLTGRCLTTQKLSDGESLTLPSGTVIVKTEKESVICQ